MAAKSPFLIKELQAQYLSAMTEKQKYALRWARIAALTGIADPLAVIGMTAASGAKTSTEQFELDSNVFDPAAASNIFVLSNYTTTMLFGNRQKFLLKATDKESQSYHDAVAEAANEMFEMPAGMFASATRTMIETSCIPFGNGGYLIKEDKENKCVVFEPLTCADTCIIEGKNGVIEGIILNRLVSVQNFVESFGDLPKDIEDALRQEKRTTKDIQLLYYICKNPYYQKGKPGRNGMPWIGVYCCEKIDSSWSHVNFFSYKPFVFYRNVVMRGEIYARGNIDRVLGSVDSANELTRIANEAVERMENPAIAITAEVNSDSVIDMSPGGVNVLTPMPGQNGTPMFAMQPSGDPSGILKTSIPRYDQFITQAFGLSMFLDVNPVAGMTARQVLEQTISRNKNALPTYLGYREQILLPLFDIVCHIVEKNRWYDTSITYPSKKSGRRVVPLNAMEEVYTSNVMEKLAEIGNMFMALRNVMPKVEIMFSLYPMVRNALKGSKYEPYLVSESTFKSRVQAMARVEATAMYAGKQMEDGLAGVPKPGTPEGDVEIAEGSV